jgi:hypothetical protein
MVGYASTDHSARTALSSFEYAEIDLESMVQSYEIEIEVIRRREAAHVAKYVGRHGLAGEER